MESKWSGDIEFAFFNSDIIDRSRKINTPEYEASGRIGKDGYYVLGVDYGRVDCPSEVAVIKVTPTGNKNGRALKQLVNLYTFDKEHTAMQALKLKRIYNKYKCRAVVVDGNGPGQGFVDALVIDQTDPETGETLYGWGVINDDNDVYKPLETENTIKNLLYVMKANPAINSECYSYCQSELRDGRIRMLIPESLAKEKLMEQSQGQKMTPSQRANYLMPFMQTNILKEQLMNLVHENEGAHIILKQSNSKIKKDKFSAFIYGLYYCKLAEDKAARHKKRNISDFMFFN